MRIYIGQYTTTYTTAYLISSGATEDLKHLDTFSPHVEESIKSESSLSEDVGVEVESVKPKVEGDPWMESKPKAETDSEFGAKTERWIKAEDLAKKEMKMEWIVPTHNKFIGQKMKIESKDFMEEKVLWDPMTKLEAMDPGLYKIISADMLRLDAQNFKLEEELACKKKELAQKDDLIAMKDRRIGELQQRIHALQPENQTSDEEMIGNSKEELENPSNFQWDIPNTQQAVLLKQFIGGTYVAAH